MLYPGRAEDTGKNLIFQDAGKSLFPISEGSLQNGILFCNSQEDSNMLPIIPQLEAMYYSFFR